MGTLYFGGTELTFGMIKETEQQQQQQLLVDRNDEGFELLEKLGEGGMGAVFKARQVQLDRIVALKMLHKDLCKTASAVERLRKEAIATGRLAHPNIVRIFSVNVGRNRELFLVLEYVEGKTVAQVLKETGGAVSVDKSVEICTQVLNALEAAHSDSLVHRDIKPSNIMIAADGRAKLLDFGIAKALDRLDQRSGGGTTSGVIGSPSYMSPEQCRSDALDGRSDIYSVGCVLYEMLTGQQLFRGATPLETTYKQLHETPQFSAELDHRFREAIAIAIAKSPQDRFHSATEFCQFLEDCASRPRLPAVAIQASANADKSVRQRRSRPEGFIKTGLAAAGIVGLSCIAGFHFWHGDRSATLLTTNCNSTRAQPRSVRELRDEIAQTLTEFRNKKWKTRQEQHAAYKEAAQTYEKQLASFPEEENERELSISSQLLATEVLDKDPATAERLLTQASTLARKVWSPLSLQYTSQLVLLARVEDFRGKHEQAFAHMNEAIRNRKRTNDYATVADAYEALGNLYLSRTEFAKAESCLQIAIDWYRKTQQSKPLKEFLIAEQELASAQRGMHKTKEAAASNNRAIRDLETYKMPEGNQSQGKLVDAAMMRITLFSAYQEQMAIATDMADPELEQQAMEKAAALSRTLPEPHAYLQRNELNHLDSIFVLDRTPDTAIKRLADFTDEEFRNKYLTVEQYTAAKSALAGIKRPITASADTWIKFKQAQDILRAAIPS